MADQAYNRQAQISTGNTQTSRLGSRCPTWDTLGAGADLPPFFNPRQDLKRQGFRIRFLSDHPRKETPNAFDGRNRELWFDVEYQGQTLTWTISQISLLLELKKHEPLSGKSFFIQLTPVDEEFLNTHPHYRGKDRYEVTPMDDEIVEEII